MYASKTTHTVPPADHRLEVVADEPALLALAERLAQEPLVALDTESNSLYAYRERVCLIQFSVPGADYLVDPLSLRDLTPLQPIFESETVEKVVHAADYDLMVLRRDFGFVTRHIFDTMWAARVLGWPKVGLGDILNSLFGVSLNKRYQRYNWGKRPLDPKALRYAWMDSHYLLPLREIQLKELRETGRLEEAREIFTYLAQTASELQPDKVDHRFWRIKGGQRLSLEDQRRLYQLYLWRERTAEALDRPPMKVLSNALLVRLVRVRPRSRQELFDAGLSAGQVRRFGSQLLKLFRDTRLPDLPAHTPSVHHDDVTQMRFEALRSWRREVARVRGVDPDVILPNAVLWQLAAHPPVDREALAQIPGIGPWRLRAYGADLLQLVHQPAQGRRTA